MKNKVFEIVKQLIEGINGINDKIGQVMKVFECSLAETFGYELDSIAVGIYELLCTVECKENINYDKVISIVLGAVSLKDHTCDSFFEYLKLTD